MHTHMHTHMHAHTCMRTHACTHTRKHAHMYTHARTHTHTPTHAHTHTHTHAHVRAHTHTHTHTHTGTCTHDYLPFLDKAQQLQEQSYPFLSPCAVFLHVQINVRLPLFGFLMCAQTLTRAIAHWGMYRHRNRVCTGSRLWDSDPHQYYTWLFRQDTLPAELSPPLKLLSCCPMNDPLTKEHFSINFKTTAALASVLCGSGKRVLPPNCSAVRGSRCHTCSVWCLLISRPRPHLLRYYVDLERGFFHQTAVQSEVAGVTLAASGVGVTGVSMDAVAAIPAVGPPLSRLAT